jgi:hypothetical protein
MDIQSYVEYIRLQGDRVIATKTCFWQQYRPFFYIAIPIFHTHNISEAELRSMRLLRAWAGLMYSCDHRGNGKTDFWSISDSSYDLTFLSNSCRKQTKQGLQRCKIEELEWDRLDKEGLKINKDALKRQGRKSWNAVLTSQSLWHKRMVISQKFSDVQAWGAFVDNQLAAYVITVRLEDDLSFLSAMSLTEYLDHRPNNALVFSVVQEMFKRGCKRVFYGVRPQENALAHFEEGIGFKILGINHNLVLNPLFTPIVKQFEKYRRLHKTDETERGK